ncbi:MAG: hydroxymethylbilane synthase [Actinobacteria bacterium]|nr:MAG: hydroxymethylbilane synthase [Actinomycetota bacterium]
MKKLTIGTRGSKLALWQANYISSLLKDLFQGQIELKIIKTKGDKILDSPLAKIGDKGLFVKEIETALLNKEVDLAVHSMKDLPTDIPSGLTICGATKREDPRDAFISLNCTCLNDLPPSAKVATSSLRRKSQLLNLRSDLTFVDIRGNVETRLKKLEEGQFDALIMAVAGVKRLGLESVIRQVIPTEISLPAVGQGMVAVEAREDDKKILGLIDKISQPESMIMGAAERALMKRLEGGCQVPIGALADVDGQMVKMRAMVASLDGKEMVKGSIEGPTSEAAALGVKLANELLASGAGRILEEIRS